MIRTVIFFVQKFLLLILWLNISMASTTKLINVIVWSELTEPKKIYQSGINQLIADFLNKETHIVATTANLDNINSTISENTLKNTDVLIWFGHKKHDYVSNQVADLIKKFVDEKGMGFIALHSAHFSKPFKKILNCSGSWQSYQEDMGSEEIIVVDFDHPIATGVKNFHIPQEENYREPFDVPPPLHTIIKGKWKDGSENREVMTWQKEKGRVVYIRAGHETYPTYHIKEMQRLITNAVYWAAHQS
jgi:trehalose utilization protein